jgi:hypothetical protein
LSYGWKALWTVDTPTTIARIRCALKYGIPKWLEIPPMRA